MSELSAAPTAGISLLLKFPISSSNLPPLTKILFFPFLLIVILKVIPVKYSTTVNISIKQYKF